MEISTFLKKNGCFPNLNGYHCLILAVDIVKKNNRLKMVKEVYPEVARQLNTTPSKVERAIRHIISSKLDMKAYKEIGLSKRPTNSELIYYFAEEWYNYE